MPDYEAPFTTIAYYQQPPETADPGSTSSTCTRPRRARGSSAGAHVARVDPGPSPADRDRPGAGELPAFRRHDGLHRVRRGVGALHRALAEEMGLYPTPSTDRQAQLRRVARVAARRRHGHPREGLDPRAGRAVHARAHRAHAREHLERGRSLHRLAGAGARVQGRAARDPGAAQEAEAKLGAAFDPKAFHDVVLEQGAVTLPVLRDAGRELDGERRRQSSSRALSALRFLDRLSPRWRGRRGPTRRGDPKHPSAHRRLPAHARRRRVPTCRRRV